jgi:periplasmic divalent cation tolerance protein
LAAKSTEIQVVLCTCPPEHADTLARALVSDRLVACVNVVPAVQSVYRWEGAVQSDTESLLIMKTRQGSLEALIAAIESQHPYDVPEVLSLPIGGGSEAYLSWVLAETGTDTE